MRASRDDDAKAPRSTRADKKFLLALGLHLRELRSSRGWSQEEFAFQCDLHRTYIGGVERGERNISVLNLRRIATALHLPVREVLPEEPEHTRRRPR